jgi:hypothetical protein
MRVNMSVARGSDDAVDDLICRVAARGLLVIERRRIKTLPTACCPEGASARARKMDRAAQSFNLQVTIE